MEEIQALLNKNFPFTAIFNNNTRRTGRKQGSHLEFSSDDNLDTNETRKPKYKERP